MLTRLWHMLIKEFIQVFRDRRTRIVLLVPPLVQLMVFGYAATFELRHVRLAVLDFDNTPESRELASRFASSPYFGLRARLGHRDEVAEQIDRGEASMVLQIHAGFAQRLGKGETAPVQVILDGTDSNAALIALGYVQEIAQDFAREVQLRRLQRISPLAAAQVPRIELERRPWFNTDLQSRWFFVPGVIGSLTLVIVTTLTAFAIVREREIGTLEQLMVTPLSRAEFILGKTLPFFLIGLLDVAMIALVGTFWFEIPFRGSLGVLFLGTVVYLLCTLGIGLFISTVSVTQQQAMVTAFFFIMPAVTFSGFGFPISSMPEGMQWISYLDPLRYFLIVIRGVYLKGIGLDVLWPQIAALALFAVTMLTVSTLRFQKSLD